MTTDKDTRSSNETIIDINPDDVVDVGANSTAQPTSLAPKRPGYLWPLFGIGAVLLGALGGGWLYRDVMSPYFPSEQMSRLIERAETLETGNAALRDKLTSLDTLTQQFKTDIDALEASVTGANSEGQRNGDAVRALADRAGQIEKALKDVQTAQAALQSTVTTLQSAPASATTSAPTLDLTAINQRLDALEKDLVSLKSAAGQGDGDTAALSQSLSDLKAKFAAGAPFADELSRVQRMAPAAPGLDDLARLASTGVPDATALAVSLRAIAKDLTPAPAAASAATDDSWSGWAMDILSDVVTIRNAGDADWVKTAEAAAAFAESGDLTQAIAHVTAAEGAKPPALQQWLEQAQARVSLEATLGDVEAAVLRMLAAKG
jgi:hypothetical protein